MATTSLSLPKLLPVRRTRSHVGTDAIPTNCPLTFIYELDRLSGLLADIDRSAALHKLFMPGHWAGTTRLSHMRLARWSFEWRLWGRKRRRQRVLWRRAEPWRPEFNYALAN